MDHIIEFIILNKNNFFWGMSGCGIILIIIIGLLICCFDDASRVKTTLTFNLILTGLLIGFITSYNFFLNYSFNKWVVFFGWFFKRIYMMSVHQFFISFIAFMVGGKLAFLAAIAIDLINTFFITPGSVKAFNAIWALIIVIYAVGPYYLFRLLKNTIIFNDNTKKDDFYAISLSFCIVTIFINLLYPWFVTIHRIWLYKPPSTKHNTLTFIFFIEPYLKRLHLFISLPISCVIICALYNNVCLNNNRIARYNV